MNIDTSLGFEIDTDCPKCSDSLLETGFEEVCCGTTVVSVVTLKDGKINKSKFDLIDISETLIRCRKCGMIINTVSADDLLEIYRSKYAT